MKVKFLLIFSLFVSILPAYAESHTQFSGIENPTEYSLEVDGHVFLIPYNVNAEVIAMEIDPELTSLLIAVDNTVNSIFTIDLEHELIRANNNDFAILVNGLEVDYEIVSDSNSSTLTFLVPEFTEEVEIIGTHVIPEFPFGILIVMTFVFSIVSVVSRTKMNIFRL